MSDESGDPARVFGFRGACLLLLVAWSHQSHRFKKVYAAKSSQLTDPVIEVEKGLVPNLRHRCMISSR